MAVIGALLLVANFTVTAAMSGWAAMTYFQVPDGYVPAATAGLILGVGLMNFFGPKHSGSLAILLAAPMVIVVLAIIVMTFGLGVSVATLLSQSRFRTTLIIERDTVTLINGRRRRVLNWTEVAGVTTQGSYLIFTPKGTGPPSNDPTASAPQHIQH